MGVVVRTSRQLGGLRAAGGRAGLQVPASAGHGASGPGGSGAAGGAGSRPGVAMCRGQAPALRPPPPLPGTSGVRLGRGGPRLRGAGGPGVEGARCG